MLVKGEYSYKQTPEDKKRFEENWDRIFGKKEKKKVKSKVKK